MIIGYSRTISGGGGGGSSDPYFANVVLLMGFEGSNGATGAPGMNDESPSVHGTASGGSASSNISTAHARFGGSSLSLSGNHIHFADSADFNFGTGLFTVETFIYPTSISGAQFIVGQWNNTGDLGWILWLNGATLSWNNSTTGSDNNFDMSGGSLSANVQHHVAIDFDGSKYRLYLDGTMVSSSTVLRNIFNSPDELSIGASQNGSFNLTGYLDELRITKGVARYASDGGFTVPTSAYPRS